MMSLSSPYPVDTKDRQLVEILIENARTPLDQLSNELDLSVDEITGRITQLENIGIIKCYRAVVDPYLYTLYFYEDGPMGMKARAKSKRAKR